MGRLSRNLVRYFNRLVVGSSSVVDQVHWLAKEFHLDLYQVALHDRGIMKYGTMETTGEQYVISQVLPCLMNTDRPVLVDVGANTGDYAVRLRQSFPSAQIIAIEPNPVTYQSLQKAVADLDITTLMVGTSDENCTTEIHSYAHDHASEHASLYAGVLHDLHGARTTSSIEVSLTTLDKLAEDVGLESIDFIKIDTEGHEFATLRGARQLLEESRLRVIQFEFNEMNVISKVFLKDFYDLLPNHEFYRVDTCRLLPLGKYSARNEIFQFQNILAIPHGELSQKCDSLARGR
jgi:FkbM family methyltransferase